MTIIPDEGPFEPGDVLTCSADGYNRTYTWTGVVNGVTIDPYIGSAYTLPAGDFQVFCTATVSELMCTDTASESVEGTAVGKCEINTMISNCIYVNASVCKKFFITFNASNAYYDDTHVEHITALLML